MTTSRPEYVVRPARASELPLLAEIEREAGLRFEAIPELRGLPDAPMPTAALAAGLARGQIWVAATVATGTVVGFALAELLDGVVHLEELDVMSTWGRRGIGQALVTAVVDDAKARGVPAVTLTTFRDVPWNAPYYVGLGFRILDPTALTPGLVRLVADEARHGLPAALRVVMRREVD